MLMLKAFLMFCLTVALAASSGMAEARGTTHSAAHPIVQVHDGHPHMQNASTSKIAASPLHDVACDIYCAGGDLATIQPFAATHADFVFNRPRPERTVAVLSRVTLPEPDPPRA